VDVEGPVGFMLIDIWTPMARPALALIAPHLRGARSHLHNSLQFREAYGESSSSFTIRAMDCAP
jgi:hypothetical protein